MNMNKREDLKHPPRSMISADLVTAAVLITFGVVYGFVSPTQLVIISLIEPLAMKINEHLVAGVLHVSSARQAKYHILNHVRGCAWRRFSETLHLTHLLVNVPSKF